MRLSRFFQGATLAFGALFAPLASSASAVRATAATEAVAACEHTCKTRPERACVACLEESYERDLQSTERAYEDRARSLEREARHAARQTEREHADRLAQLERSLQQNERNAAREELQHERELARRTQEIERGHQQGVREYEQRLAAEERRIEQQAAELERHFAGDELSLERELAQLEREMESVTSKLEAAWELESRRYETELASHENLFEVAQEQLERQWEDREAVLERELEAVERALEQQVESLELQFERQAERLESEREAVQEARERAFEEAGGASRAVLWSDFDFEFDFDFDGDCDEDCTDACSGCEDCDDCCDDEDATDDRGSVVRVLERALRQAGLGGSHARDARSTAATALRQQQRDLVERRRARDTGCDAVRALRQAHECCDDQDPDARQGNAVERLLHGVVDLQGRASAPRGDLATGYAFEVDAGTDRITVRDVHGALGTATVDELEELAPGVYVLRGRGGELRLEAADCGDAEESVVFRFEGPERHGIHVVHPSGTQGEVSFDELADLDSGVYVLRDDGDGIALLPADPTAPAVPAHPRADAPAAPLAVTIPRGGAGDVAFFPAPEPHDGSSFFAVRAAPRALAGPDPAELEEVSELLREMREEIRALRSSVGDLRQELRSPTQDVR